ncbi:bifunctional serine/threonine-protein kinase/ABC transporter substrate-binding protein [Streptomyces lavendulocolor]|uniref:bifunctional serine/threonine-protein kinase/ABC transporter substrate-binding protein n=1 Tax=Streptomyces lavendulocolor TaxID=67316 RepID=UPI003C2CA713
MTEDNPGLIAGRYQLVERIGQGGMGRVWRGIDQQLFGREVAIKEILFPPGMDDGDRSTLLRRFTGEARAAVTLSHPGIITIHDVVEHDGAPVIVMEFVRGQSLAAAIREQGRLPVHRVAEIGSAMLDALTEAHEARIVHRDIKPDNVLLTKDRVVLTDFGIAHLADATTKLSHSGVVIGTPHYMPPEQLEGKRPTPANDLWALGATLYHAVEGHPPFDADGLHALAIAVFTRPHRPPVHAGPLAPVLDALLTKDPAQRAGAAEAAELLAPVLRGTGPGAGSRPGSRNGSGAGLPVPAPEQAPPPEPVPVPKPVPAPDAVTETAPTPTVPDGKPPAGDASTAPTSGGTGLPLPDRPTAPANPVPPPEDAVSLGAGRPGGAGGEGGTARRRALGRRSAVLAVALATLAAGVLTWSLTRDTPGGGRNGGAGGAAGTGGGAGSPATRVVIGVDAPLTGDLTFLGAGIKNSADLAVRTANRTRHVPGVTFEIKALDDAAQPAKGQENATRFVADDKVLAVVGPLNSAVASSMLGPLGEAGLVNVSPANTNPALTHGPGWAAGTRTRQYETYFRTVGTDVDQGPYAARYLYQDARKTKVFVIDDRSDHGAGLATGFTSELRALGGTVVGTEHVGSGGGDFTALAVKIRASGAQAVYFGGYYTTAAPLSQRLKEAGAGIPLMGGDGIFDPQYVRSNTRAEGDLATSIGAPAEELARGPAFLAQYREAGYQEGAGTYGAYAYDATWAVIEAVKAVAAANGGTLPPNARSRMPGAVAGVSFDGFTGPVAFDAYGDTVNRRFTVHTVKDGTWKTLKSGPHTP